VYPLPGPKIKKNFGPGSGYNIRGDPVVSIKCNYLNIE
jgi:hypothetical protein